MESEIAPIAFIGSLAIGVIQLPKAMNSIIFPLAFIVASIQVYESANAISFVVELEAFKFSLLVLFNHKIPLVCHTLERFYLYFLWFLRKGGVLAQIGVNHSNRQFYLSKFALRELQNLGLFVQWLAKGGLLDLSNFNFFNSDWTVVEFDGYFGFLGRLSNHCFHFGDIEGACGLIGIDLSFLSQIQ